MAVGKREGEFLYDELKKRILADYSDKPYFTPLPSERDLCSKYNVSRPTVRKALLLLEEEKFIVKIPTKGTFFLGNKEFVDGQSETSKNELAFYNRVVLRGNYTSSKVLFQNIEPASLEVAAKLELKKGDYVFRLERLRYINGKVYSLANAYLPYMLCSGLLEKDFTNRSLYRTLAEYGIYPSYAHKVIEISKAEEYEALHLGIQVGDPITITYTVTFDENDRILEYVISKSLAYKTRIELTVSTDRERSGKLHSFPAGEP
ncbi:GntR family transcriptional regulator [Propionispora hippei DSM 15287]|uniref:GntR family transcriptional regulator n=1 Tax=Propionispora hippei DSM 15287 TaxID=1123003 RepID=A0A1M6DT65_9FIRM|nr:GntR family transcriptional regulator [Propionispora hippei DSM 15287]